MYSNLNCCCYRLEVGRGDTQEVHFNAHQSLGVLGLLFRKRHVMPCHIMSVVVIVIIEGTPMMQKLKLKLKVAENEDMLSAIW